MTERSRVALRVAAAACALAISAGAGRAQDHMTAADIGSFRVELLDVQGACVVAIEGNPALSTGLPAPCGFVHRTGEDVPQIFTYEPVLTIAFIAGPEAEGGCASGVQALRLDGSRFSLGAARALPGEICHEGGFEEEAFRREAGLD